MDIIKHLEFFNPLEMEDSIHIIGLGAIGSTVAETLTRLGLSNLHFYDFDGVVPHNIANQMYTDSDIGKLKVDCMVEHCKAINRDIEITVHKEGWKSGCKLSGYVFLCVDNIEIRKAIVLENKYNTNIKAMFDFRMGLDDAQHYAANWADKDMVENLYRSMDFTHEEAKEATPVSACGTTLSVITTIRVIVSLGISNMINFIKLGTIKKVMLINAFSFTVDSF